ncbi:hypothetical protein DVS28_b0495 (plasmid) [Euzebya pacifica]|uniref:Uncharacterized protein n=1 Tax=Euzebya pacifica TaxID=1608957 RepID=A0A346Y6Y8_9ACTN|nr:hypothetical protein [Euzebya pacifica]AXV10235.1 hypothetical protein DVS28_b0495 [Euzebya pacifica]
MPTFTSLDDLLPHLIDTHRMDPVRLASTGTIADARALGRLHTAAHRDDNPSHTHGTAVANAPQQHLTDAEIEADRTAVYGPAAPGKCLSCRDRVDVRPDGRCDACIGLPARGGDGSMAACPACDWWYVPGTETVCGDCDVALPDLPYPWKRTYRSAEDPDNETYAALRNATADRIAHLERAWASEYADLVEDITGMRPVRIHAEVKHDDDLFMHRMWDADGTEGTYDQEVNGVVLGEISEFDTVAGDEWSTLADEGNYELDVPPRAYRYVLAPTVQAVGSVPSDDFDREVERRLSSPFGPVEGDGWALYVDTDPVQVKRLPTAEGTDDVRALLTATVVGTIEAADAARALGKARRVVADAIQARTFQIGGLPLLFTFDASDHDRILGPDETIDWGVTFPPVAVLSVVAADEDTAWAALEAMPTTSITAADGSTVWLDLDTDDEDVTALTDGRCRITTSVVATASGTVTAADPRGAFMAAGDLGVAGEHDLDHPFPGVEMSVWIDLDRKSDETIVVPLPTSAVGASEPTRNAAPCVYCGAATAVFTESPHLPADDGWEPVRLHLDSAGVACGSSVGWLQDRAYATTANELTPTQRKIAIEHIKAICGVSKNVAANHVDEWTFAGLPVPEAELLTVVRSAVAGQSTPPAVGLVLRSLGVDVDVDGDVVCFGVTGDDWFNWSPGASPVVTLRGGRMVPTPDVEGSTGQRLGTEVPEANPLRTAKALRRLLG